MGVTFEQPGWLWLIALAIPITWVGIRWFSSMSRIRRWSAVAMRVALVSLISGMLAGASTVRRTDTLAVIGIIDVSDSARLFGRGVDAGDAGILDPIAAAKRFLIAAQGERGPDDLLGVVVFDGRAAAVAMPTRGNLSGRSFDMRIMEGSDIGAALRYGAALVPPDAAGRLVLISDGVETTGNALDAARELAGRRGRLAPVDVAVVELDAVREVMVESVDAPPRAAEGATIAVRVTIRSTGPATGILQLSHEEQALDINGSETGTGRRLSLEADRHVEIVPVPLPAGRIHRFEASFVPDTEPGPRGEPRAIGDTRVENNRASALTVTSGKGAVLLLDGVNTPGGPGGGGLLARTLGENGIDVTVMPPEAMPADPLALAAFDLVILENVPAEAVSPAGQRVLTAHVKDMGGGLVMVGGPDSLGAGGWKGSEIEPLLPVKLDLPEKLVQPDAAVMLVMDNSGSMGREVLGSIHSQQEIANQAAAMAVRTLDKKDMVGVIVFNSVTTVVTPIGPNTDSKATADRILSIAPGGGTVMGPALVEAGKQIGGVKSATKHIIVLSDGRSIGYEELPQLAERIHIETGASITTISVGDAADEKNMGEIADRGGGKSFIVNNPNLLPKFFLKAVRVIRTPLIREGAFDPVILPVVSPLTAGLYTPPRLLGMVLTQKRPEGTITYAMAAPTGEPLLAHWNVELGKVGVFTSDASRWAQHWASWPGYGQMWVQVVRSLSRAGLESPFELVVEPAGDSLRLRLDATGSDGKPVDQLSVPVTVHGPGGKQVQSVLSQTGPGMYEGTVPAMESGSYFAVVKPLQGGQPLPVITGTASVSSGVEFRQLSTNRPLLEQIARETGGRVLNLAEPGAVKLFDRTGLEAREARTPLWRSLLLWTLLVLLLDVGTRRIAWDRFVSREFGMDLRKTAAESVADRGAKVARVVTRLREAPKRIEAELELSAPVRLSEEDAQRVVEEQQERRRQARLTAVQAMRDKQRREQATEAGEDSVSGESKDSIAVPQEPRSDEQPGGLFEAKKRARERMDRGDGGGEGAA